MAISHTPLILRSKLHIFVLIFALAGFSSTGIAHAATNDTTTVVIVGTVHNKTDKYDAKMLEAIIERVKPGLILVELDSSFITASKSIKQEFRNISLENMAVASYQEAHSVSVCPYDIEGRNKIYQDHNYFQLQKDLSKALNKADEDSLVRGESSLLLEAIDRFDGITRAFGSETPEVINSGACDIAMESKQFYAGEGMLEIVTSVPTLKQFEEFATFKRDFWVTRNEAMVKNILNWISTLHPKTTLVVCGFEHRYYLRQQLEAHSSSNHIVLTDYRAY